MLQALHARRLKLALDQGRVPFFAIWRNRLNQGFCGTVQAKKGNLRDARWTFDTMRNKVQQSRKQRGLGGWSGSATTIRHARTDERVGNKGRQWARNAVGHA